MLVCTVLFVAQGANMAVAERGVPVLPPLPLVGRAAELEMLRHTLDTVKAGHPATVFLVGEPGIGKSRLLEAVVQQTKQSGWQVAFGRAYPVETGAPYASFADALLPVLRSLPAATLATLTRGGVAELTSLFPALATDESPRAAPRGDAAEVKTRLFWNFSQFLGRLSAKQPLLLALDNMQWADTASLELLHFVARQLAGTRIAIVVAYLDTPNEHNAALRTVQQSLASLDVAQRLPVPPLSRAATEELLCRVFDAEAATVREFAALLFGWTRGNPLFMGETLKALVQDGRLYRSDGTWHGWGMEHLQLAPSVRDVMIERAAGLSPTARGVADLAAVIGTRVTHSVLVAVSALEPGALIPALTELLHAHILTEHADGAEIIYDFTHPLLRDTLYGELGLARARSLHGAVAEALERYHGPRAGTVADELAYHYARADARELAPKAVEYLRLAGSQALRRHANREAASYLRAAAELLDRGHAPEDLARILLLEELAQACQRIGRYDDTSTYLELASGMATRQGLSGRRAGIERRMGTLCHWRGRHEEALAHYDAGIAAAGSRGNEVVVAGLQVSKASCLEALGQAGDAEKALLTAMALAERHGGDVLLARVHRSLALTYLWMGASDQARDHATRALAHAQAGDEPAVAWSAHWSLAALAGLTGDGAATVLNVAHAERIANELRSPVLGLWVNEIAVEYKSMTGDWRTASALASRSIELARLLDQRSLLPRLLVSAGIIAVERGQFTHGKQLLDDAWTLAGAAAPDDGRRDIHTLMRAYTGMTIYHLMTGAYDEAIRVGDEGLGIVDRSGYAVWAIHRLLPSIIEALLWKREHDVAERYIRRLRRDSERVGQRLGLILADVGDALVSMLRGTTRAGLARVLACADALEEIPLPFDGARLRREIARRHIELGDPAAAVTQLRRAHAVFARLDARAELEGTRTQLRELGARMPTQLAGAGTDGLTGRELDIIRLVVVHKSNKEIARALGISARTVSTHLSNIFKKLGVDSRGAVADAGRNLA